MATSKNVLVVFAAVVSFSSAVAYAQAAQEPPPTSVPSAGAANSASQDVQQQEQARMKQAYSVAGGQTPSDLPTETGTIGISDRLSNLLKSSRQNGKLMKLYGNWKAGDQSAVAGIFEQARGGNALAQNLAGYMLDNGEGVRQDSQAAAAYFSHAAETIPLARYNLGLLYYYGRGVKKDQDKAAELFRHSVVSAGVGQGAVLLSIYYLQRQDLDNAFKWANEGANRGDIKAFYLLGRILYVRGNYRDARMWIEKASAAAEPNAPALMARMYIEGQGIDKNLVMGEAWSMIYAGLNHKNTGRSVTSGAALGLSDDDERRAVAFAQNWLATHREPRNVDYRRTLLEVS